MGHSLEGGNSRWGKGAFGSALLHKWSWVQDRWMDDKFLGILGQSSVLFFFKLVKDKWISILTVQPFEKGKREPMWCSG